MLSLFLIASVLLAYTYVGFPLLVLLRGLLLQRPYHCDSITPRVSILIAAHNEADCIQEKIRNLLSCAYPTDQLEIIVASDGSSDVTAALVEQCDSDSVRLLDLPRQGKAAALNAAAAVATGQILVFTDANSMFTQESVLAS